MFRRKKKSRNKNVSENKVRIEVWRLLGGNVPYSIAKFEATQFRDVDNNLVLVDANNNFKDDVDIVKHKLIGDLHERLELHKENIDERIEIVKKRIKEQQSRIAKIKDGYIEEEVEADGKKEKKKTRVNQIDEDCKLREYTALLDVLQNSGEGSYETIDSDGLKRIFYLYKEGILIPYKIIKAKTTMYPDISTKRKAYKENQDLIDQDYANDTKGIFSGWRKWVAIAIMLIWLIANIYYSVNLNRAYANFDEQKAAQYGTQCAYWCSNVVGETENFINAYNQILAEREKEKQSDSVSVG